MPLVKLEVGKTFFFRVFLASKDSIIFLCPLLNVEGFLDGKCYVKYKFSINFSECDELLLRKTFISESIHLNWSPDSFHTLAVLSGSSCLHCCTHEVAFTVLVHPCCCLSWQTSELKCMDRGVNELGSPYARMFCITLQMQSGRHGVSCSKDKWSSPGFPSQSVFYRLSWVFNRFYINRQCRTVALWAWDVPCSGRTRDLQYLLLYQLSYSQVKISALAGPKTTTLLY